VGTKLVQPLCRVLENAAHGEDFLQLITRTQGEVCEEPIDVTGIAADAGQTPEILYNARQRLVVEKFRSVYSRVLKLVLFCAGFTKTQV